MTPEVLEDIKEWLRVTDARSCKDWDSSDIVDFILHINRNGYTPLDPDLPSALNMLLEFIAQGNDDPYGIGDTLNDGVFPDGLGLEPQYQPDFDNKHFEHVSIINQQAFCRWIEVAYVANKLNGNQ